MIRKTFVSLVCVVLLVVMTGGGLSLLVGKLGKIDKADMQPAVAAQDDVWQNEASGKVLAPVVAGLSPPHEAIATDARNSLIEAMRRDGDSLQVEILPDGTELLDLGGRFNHVSAVVRTPDGAMAIQCFSAYTALDNAISSGTPDHPATHQGNEAVTR